MLPGNLHLSASRIHAHRHRYFCILQRSRPRWNTISISGIICVRPLHGGPGSSLHAGRRIAYVEAAIRAGLDVDSFASSWPSSSAAITPSSKKLQIQGGSKALGKDHERTIQSKKRMNPACSGFTPDGRLFAHRSATRQQCGEGCFPALAACMGDPIPPHEFQR